MIRARIGRLYKRTLLVATESGASNPVFRCVTAQFARQRFFFGEKTMLVDAQRNWLLAALPPDAWQRWEPLLEPVELPLGQVLYESGQTLSHVYFPTTAIISLLFVMESGASAEIAVVGNDGLVGVSLFMGGECTPSRAVVQSAGLSVRLGAQALKDEFGRAPVLLR